MNDKLILELITDYLDEVFAISMLSFPIEYSMNLNLSYIEVSIRYNEYTDPEIKTIHMIDLIAFTYSKLNKQ